MWFKKKTVQTDNKGQEKEQQACDWLKQQGFTVLQQNYHCRGGEIDIIALSPSPTSLPFTKIKPNQEPTLVFFEVKYRKNSQHGHPAEFVTPQKQHKIQLCAQHFLLKHAQFDDLPMRFDVITFEGAQTTPDWIQDAFGV